ncbi:acetyl-CoA synthetase-like protein [Obba rivulosa]|uniref:Acetyl-CoA synthetase-like protein n=1 Tax=Obba rivulosa TaxID=1052685 RepID=A0A8E2J2E6_9APHY|nr:acetyl-CoA synthetase-like protein [Obba rivulosa]
MSTSQLLADCFVEHCGKNPDDIFCHIIHPDAPNPTTERKTNGELLRDAFGAAEGFRNFGLSVRRPGDPPSTVAILMRSGYACFIQFLGILLNRCQPVLISPRNSTEGVVHLIRESKTHLVVTDRTQPDVLAVVRIQFPSLTVIDATDNHANIGGLPTDALPPLSNEDFAKEFDSVVYYLHTSGSTGHPKLIPETSRNWKDKVDRLSSYPGRPLVPMAPMFHTMGLGCLNRFPFGAGCIPVIVETKQPYTGELLCRVLVHYPGAICVVPPTILDDIASGEPNQVETLATAHRVIFAGAALSQQVGDKLAAENVKLVSAFGSTETGQLTLSDTASDDPQDWSYVRFLDPEQVYFVPVAQSDNLYQLVVRPGRFVAPHYVNYTNPVGFCSGDIWKRHPTKAGLWKHMGRRGAVTVLSNGEKTDNLQLESLLTESPLVKYAIVFGEGRFQNGVIIQPPTSSWTHDEFMGSLWPTVEHVNSVVPKHSRLVKDLVLIAPTWKPFILSDKATVRRHETLNQYEAEIEDAYAKLESGAGGDPLPDVDDDEGALTYVRNLVKGLIGKDVDDDANLFDHGMDSMLAMNCRSGLLSLAKLRGHDMVPRNVIYQHPSVGLLYDFVIHDNSSDDTGPAYMQDILADLERDWKLPPKRAVHTNGLETICDGGLAVLLTGSTGTLGSQVLTRLLESPKVATVYCLNRRNVTNSITERQRKHMDDSTLLDRHITRVSFWDMNLTQPDLGLHQNALEQIRKNVTHVVHCAWEVNFNHTVRRFVGTQLIGVRNIIDLSLSSSRPVPPRVVFLSSIAAVANYQGPEDKIPEQVFEDLSLPLHQGYAEAKFLAERLLAKASDASGLPVTIIRGGQLSGSTRTGAWNVMEFIPIFFQSCHLLGRVPNALPDVRWLPTDIGATVMLDILLNDVSNADEPIVYHMEAAHILRGQALLHSLLDASHGKLKKSTVEDWLEAVKSASDEIPARRLLDVYESWLARVGGESHRPLSTEGTCKISKAAEGIPVGNELIAMYWKYSVTAINA